jgi:hypothetical protein
MIDHVTDIEYEVDICDIDNLEVVLEIAGTTCSGEASWNERDGVLCIKIPIACVVYITRELWTGRAYRKNGITYLVIGKKE